MRTISSTVSLLVRLHPRAFIVLALLGACTLVWSRTAASGPDPKLEHQHAGIDVRGFFSDLFDPNVAGKALGF